MRVLVSKNGPSQPEDLDAAIERPARVALISTISILAVAGFYFGMLYLVTH